MDWRVAEFLATQEGARIRQTNEGKWQFTLSDSGVALVLDVGVAQHLDTSEIEVDIQPSFVRLLIKVGIKLRVVHPPCLP